MLSYEVVKVAKFEFFLWSLGWLHLGELNSVCDDCTYFMCHSRW